MNSSTARRRAPWLILATFAAVTLGIAGQSAAAYADAFTLGPIEVKTPIADVTVPEVTIAHGCKVAANGVCAVPGPTIGAASPAAPPKNNYACDSAPNGDDCDGVDPEDSGCAGDATTVADGYRDSQYAQLVVAERWSEDCQSNWPSAGTNAPCYYGDNSTNCDNWSVCEGYGGGCDSRAYYSDQGMIGAYGQMLYGGPGMQCILVNATHYFSAGTSDDQSWSADQCV